MHLQFDLLKIFEVQENKAKDIQAESTHLAPPDLYRMKFCMEVTYLGLRAVNLRFKFLWQVSYLVPLHSTSFNCAQF